MRKHIQNARFSFRRNAFRVYLVLEPRLLPFFIWVLRLTVLFFILLFIGLWLVIEPSVPDAASQTQEPLPQEIDFMFLREPPFTSLREYAPRPEPFEGIGELKLTP